MFEEVKKKIRRTGVIPVAVADRAEDAQAAAEAMLAGGIDFIEITLRTDAAIDAIKLVSEKCPGMTVGAGTVINAAQCAAAIEAGAKFIVSPGFSPRVAACALDAGILPVPGCVTPTEITAALDMGLDLLKFFPAGNCGGLAALKALSAPFGGVEFIPTGGIGQADLADYLRAPFVAAVGGSWLCARGDIAGGNFEKIGALCREAAETVRAVRG
ncbi:MAG: bifunctional 4-hydroxy-2-oxoglutarate aldolase/2-dehydro-3-deoxy-phosphogluconate aldolase [Clostridia bacterium]|nr:bifunctional 4-hydroxy-2-oxoglutarate aldolase/2-dehydro-3-deoxy-phosphogluconate aldolase [Clostridia bacterium]